MADLSTSRSAAASATDRDAAASTRPTRTDRARQAVVALSALLAIAGTAVGVGAFGGTPIAQAGGGALSADGTWVAPAGPAFAIWTPIYAGLVGYAVWQALGGAARAADPRQRRVGWWFAATMLLNAAWILVVQAGLLALSVLVIVVLLGVLLATWSPLLRTAPSGRVEALVLDTTVAVYTGWVSIATVADIAATLRQDGWDGLGLPEQTWAVVLLAIAALVGLTVAALTGGRLGYACALAWGLAWIAVGRSDGSGLNASSVTMAAALAAVVVLGSALVVRRSGYRRSAVSTGAST